ncbi:cytochrome P450 [Peniophora sp. CONT]|nr:cytochrome P450 [Peniophora sp. CONT]
MTYTPTAVDIAVFVVGIYLTKRLFSRPRLTLPLPPGPPGLPLIGNVLDLPLSEPYKTYVEWGGKYGPIMHVSALGQSLIIVNDASIATEMLEKRATLYSERPTLPMGGELSGWDNTLVLLHYDDQWRAYRRHFHTFVGARVALKRHSSLLEHEARLLVQRILRAPDALDENIRLAAAGVIMKITYGYDALPEKDPLVALVNQATSQFEDVTESSKVWLVDLLPIFKHIPIWFPGASFRRTAAYYKDTIRRMAQEPFDAVKQKMKQHIAEPSMVADLLEQSTNTADEEHAIKWAAASMYSGGADTTVSTMLSLFLCMTLFPEAQRKAQAEIDTVVGRDRLPTLADRPNLPYVDAIVSEMMRWAPVVPMAIPHKLVQDDNYGGYTLPKGALVIPNVWGMLHDPAVYADPHEFKPERFIAHGSRSAEPNPRLCFFGFGRRICPGRQLADVSVWIETAVILATLSISKAHDETGKEITPSARFTNGSIVHPEPFNCDIKSRSPHVDILVAQELTQFTRGPD